MDGLTVYPTQRSPEKTQRVRNGTSLYRADAHQPCSLQELMMDSVTVYPSQHPQRRQYSPSPRSIYWTDKLAISRSSTVLPHYHTALALGATLVCSAGALIQHTEKSEVHSFDRLPSDKVIAQAQQVEPTVAVVTPPIATPQTAASFSPRTDATHCTNGTCQGQASMDRHIPLQASYSQALPTERAPLQPQNAEQQTQQAILAHRKTDLAHLQADLEARAQQSNQEFANLTTHLAIHPEDAEQIAGLLNKDASYQLNRLRLSGLKDAIAVEYSKPIADNPHLELLYDQYAQELTQLSQIAQTVLAQYIANVSAEFPDPLWQDEEYYALLQELIDIAHRRQMQVIESNILAQMEEQLTPHRTEVATLRNQDSSARNLGAS